MTEIEAHKGKHGWRWNYTSAGGASFLSPSFFPTKKAALRAGEEWAAQRKRTA